MPLPLRALFANVLAERLPEPLVRVENFPSFGRVTVTEQPACHRRNIHVMAYVPERRGNKIDMVEDLLTFRDIRLSLRLDGHKVRRVALAPDETPLEWKIEDDRVVIRVEELTGFAVVAVEFEPTETASKPPENAS